MTHVNNVQYNSVTLMYIHRMTQSEKLMVGCKPLCMQQYLQDMDIHYDYVHWINMYMGLCMQQKGASTIQGYVCRGMPD